MNQSLLSELNTGIVILDTSLRVKFINSSALTILDTTEKTSIGQKIDQLFFEEPEGLDGFQESIEQKRSFTKTDAILNLKRGTKVLCTYIVHPFSKEEDTGLLLEIINKEASSELIERYRMRANQQGGLAMTIQGATRLLLRSTGLSEDDLLSLLQPLEPEPSGAALFMEKIADLELF